MYEEDLALNNLQWLICHKTQPNQILHICTIGKYGYVRNVHGTFITYIHTVELLKNIRISKFENT